MNGRRPMQLCTCTIHQTVCSTLVLLSPDKDNGWKYKFTNDERHRCRPRGAHSYGWMSAQQYCVQRRQHVRDMPSVTYKSTVMLGPEAVQKSGRVKGILTPMRYLSRIRAESHDQRCT